MLVHDFAGIDARGGGARPAGRRSERLDRFGLHRLAETRVRAFLQELAQSFAVEGEVKVAS